MYKYIALTALLLSALSTQAQQAATTSAAPRQAKGQTVPRPNAGQQADKLTTQMVHDLHLNGYQASRVQAINATLTTKLETITKKSGGNQQLFEQQSDAVYRQRDQALRTVLSNDQFTDYYGLRGSYNEFAQNYAKKAATSEFVKSVQEPAPASSRGAVIKPASTAPDAKATSTNVRGR